MMEAECWRLLTEPRRAEVAVAVAPEAVFEERLAAADTEPLRDLTSIRLFAMASSCSSTYSTRCSGGTGVSEAFRTLHVSSWMRAWVDLSSFGDGCACCSVPVAYCRDDGRHATRLALGCVDVDPAPLCCPCPCPPCCMLNPRLPYLCCCIDAASRNGFASLAPRNADKQSLHTAILRSSIFALSLTEMIPFTNMQVQSQLPEMPHACIGLRPVGAQPRHQPHPTIAHDRNT